MRSQIKSLTLTIINGAIGGKNGNTGSLIKKIRKNSASLKYAMVKPPYRISKFLTLSLTHPFVKITTCIFLIPLSLTHPFVNS